jgi:hypothetical protein
MSILYLSRTALLSGTSDSSLTGEREREREERERGERERRETEEREREERE